MQPKYNFGKGIRIGYLSAQSVSVFCHQHTGWTAFGNISSNYSSEFNIEAIVHNAFDKVAIENDQVFVEFPEGHDKKPEAYFFNVSTWDGSLSVKDSRKAELQGLIKKYDLDILIMNGDSDPKVCNIKFLTDSRNKSAIILSKRYFSVIKADSLEYLGMNMGTGGASANGHYPSNIENLTKDEIESLEEIIKADIYNGIRDLFKAVGLGEADYVESQIAPL